MLGLPCSGPMGRAIPCDVSVRRTVRMQTERPWPNSHASAASRGRTPGHRTGLGSTCFSSPGGGQGLSSSLLPGTCPAYLLACVGANHPSLPVTLDLSLFHPQNCRAVAVPDSDPASCCFPSAGFILCMCPNREILFDLGSV